MHQDRSSYVTGSLPLVQCTGRQATASGTMIMCSYILYLRNNDVILVILCTGLLITTTVASEWLNSLIFHDILQLLVICVDIDYIHMSHYSYHAGKH